MGCLPPFSTGESDFAGPSVVGGNHMNTRMIDTQFIAVTNVFQTAKKLGKKTTSLPKQRPETIFPISYGFH